MIAAVKKSSVRLIAAVHLAGRRAPGHNTPALRRSLRAAPRVRDGLLRRLLLRQPLFILQQLLYGRCIPIASSNSKELEINERIRDKEIRLIGADGSQMGIMSPRDALRMAMDQDLDLVKVAPQAKPPVCKILDYGKYRFEMQKREKEAKKNQKVVEVKEIRLSLNIDTNDFNTKVNQAAKFLAQGHKLKVSIRFRGREMAHTNLGLDVHHRFAEALAGKGVVDKQPKLEGRSMMMFMSPVPTK
ncbi:MAG TPA: translation initiation factor IF-3 [Candidatus Gemmiger stercoripullorum]|nr:translation initiation factor IF-3 [Candidatus Gemmiger stercoripullorum]